MIDKEKFDLVVSIDGNKTSDDELLGITEIETVMENIDIYVKETEYFDVLTVEIINDGADAISQLKKSHTTSLKKVVPIETVVNSNAFEIEREVCKQLNKNAKRGDTFRLDYAIRSKNYINSPDELISRILKNVCNNFHLVEDESPTWVVEIEEVGPYTGISVLKPQQILFKQ